MQSFNRKVIIKMKILSIIFLIYAFLKSIFYGYFEIKEKENKSGGITVIVLALLGLILPISILILFL